MTQPPGSWEPLSPSDQPGRPADGQMPPPYAGPPYGSVPPGPGQPGPGQQGHGQQGYGAGGPAPEYGYAGQYGPQFAPGGPPAGSDDRTWAMMAYLGSLVIGFIAPLVVYFAKKNESPLARHHGAQALNYQITVFVEMIVSAAIAAAIAIPLDQPAFLLLAAPVWLFHIVAQWVFIILGTIKAGKGEFYRIPAFTCWRMIR